MKNILSLLLAFAVICFPSCSDKDEPTEKDVFLELVTEIQTRSTVVKMEFVDDDQMLVDAGGINITGTYSSGKWLLNPQVSLTSGETLGVTAIYPCMGTDITAIPVDIKKQIDCLYGTATATSSLPAARLNMEHALSSLAFNIQGSGTVEKVSFLLPSEGVLNAKTGNFKSGEKKLQVLLINRNMNAEGWTEEVPDVFVIPFSALTELTVTVDGRDYPVKVKQEIAQGRKYIFHLIYTGSSIYPVGVEQVPMDQYTDREQSDIRKNDLSITYSSEHTFQVNAPVIDAIAGTICWGDGTGESYAPAGVHDYAPGNHVMILETVGCADSFTISNIEYMEEINLSDF